MPGILPMKMIRVGGNSQSRIAQACDRCRSKKIRCDGVRPTCSQCSSVGFECKTSDKLSRRAFPRGYTESLEDRVRGLEAEVRELKQLLDEKDEKLDLLSRLHDYSSSSRKSSVAFPLSPASITQIKQETSPPLEEVLRVELPVPVKVCSTVHGTSTTSALIDAFEAKLREQGKELSMCASSLLEPSAATAAVSGKSSLSVAPPRLVSDQYVNLFFQEWQPLLPIFDKTIFLKLYEDYLAETSDRSFQENKLAVAQLFLLFDISAYSSSAKSKPSTTSYECQWKKALAAIGDKPSLPLLQCHALAQLCCLLKADYPQLLQHRGCGVTICHQLGLHQNHEMNQENDVSKKVFWSQYVLDKFTSATTGVPSLLRDADITTSYPADIDDSVSTNDINRSSGVVALFKMSRILSKTIEHLYPSGASYSLSLRKLHSLSDELDQWHEELPTHLRLRFVNDKPATHLTSDRSPLLSLCYFYTRILIHRPVLCHGSGSTASAATIVSAAAAKHIIQILDLLDERCMGYTFPVNKQDLLLNAGFSILWQCTELNRDSKIVQDNQKSVQVASSKLAKEKASTATEVDNILRSLTGRAPPPSMIRIDTPAAQLLNSTAVPIEIKQKPSRKPLQAMASRLAAFTSLKDRAPEEKRKLRPQVNVVFNQKIFPQNQSTTSLASVQSVPNRSTPILPKTARSIGPSASVTNLDFFNFENSSLSDPTCLQPLQTNMPPPKKRSPSWVDDQSWENLIPPHVNESPHSELFSGASPVVLNENTSASEVSNHADWGHDLWNLGNSNSLTKTNAPQSLLSLSEESLISGDDFVFSVAGSHQGSNHGSISTTHETQNGDECFKGITMPHVSIEDDLEFVEGIYV